MVALASFVIFPVSMTLVVMVNICLESTANLPIVQFPEIWLYEPVVGLSCVTYSNPAGNKSCKTTLSAALGPTLMTYIVQTTVSPLFGVELLTVLTTCTSHSGGT